MGNRTMRITPRWIWTRTWTSHSNYHTSHFRWFLPGTLPAALSNHSLIVTIRENFVKMLLGLSFSPGRISSKSCSSEKKGKLVTCHSFTPAVTLTNLCLFPPASSPRLCMLPPYLLEVFPLWFSWPEFLRYSLVAEPESDLISDLQNKKKNT